VAQNPAEFETLEKLDDNDKGAIRHEYERRWSHPRALYTTIVLCSIGAATQGWDQTGSNGANLLFPTEFGVPTKAGAPDAARNSWIVGVVNAAPYIGSAVWCALCSLMFCVPLCLTFVFVAVAGFRTP
jgi:hypothetical protein